MVQDPYAPNYDYWLLKNGFQNGFEEGDLLCGYSGGWIYEVTAMPEEPFIYVEEKPDMIILDPPRDGIHPKALPKILSYAPDRFIYVSCKPTSLARDIPMFREAGYEPIMIKPVDMFPQTVHVETVCLLKKIK